MLLPVDDIVVAFTKHLSNGGALATDKPFESIHPDLIQEFYAQRVGIETNRNYDPEVSGASVFDQVRVELVGGRIIESAKVARAKGHADRPLSEDELFEKFRTCLDAGGARIAPDVLFDRLRHLEELSARDLTAA